jgi:hypothetical protein
MVTRGALSSGLRGRVVKLTTTPPNSAEVKKMWIYISTPHTLSWLSAQLVKHRDAFKFYYDYENA